MAGESLTETEVSWHGLAGDRRWAFIRNDVPRSGFPWLTLRECPDMACYRPWFTDPLAAERSTLMVRTPAGTDLDVLDPELGRALQADGVRVIKQDRGAFDTFPLSIISTQTIASLTRVVDTPLDPRRFRPNLLVEASGDGDYPEDVWVGCTLRIGGVRLRVDKRDGRCVVITIDPDSRERNPAILRSVASERQGCLGVYATTVQPGRIGIDDEVVIEQVRVLESAPAWKASSGSVGANPAEHPHR
jgi:uncharacterized protein YcbX